MPVRSLALAALLLLSPTPAAAQPDAADAPVTAPAAQSPTGAAPQGPAPDEPADPTPAEAPASDPGAAVPPEPGAGGQPGDRTEEQPAPELPAEPGAGTTPDTAAPYVPAGPAAERAAGAGEHTDPARTGEAAPAPDSTRPPGPADLALQGRSVEGGAPATQALPGTGQVAPGTVTRIPLGSLTHVPAQDEAAAPGRSALLAVVGVLTAGVVTTVVVRRSRARRAGS